MKDYSQAFINTNGEEFPNTKAVDAGSPGNTNGTEIIADLLNDNWGFSQALLKAASISPNGKDETADNSQKLEAIKKLYNDADTALKNILTQTITQADNAVKTELNQKISKETTDRTQADTALQNNINTEKTQRTQADTTLQNNINTEKARITKEITDRTNADKNLQNQINTAKYNLPSNGTEIKMPYTIDGKAVYKRFWGKKQFKNGETIITLQNLGITDVYNIISVKSQSCTLGLFFIQQAHINGGDSGCVVCDGTNIAAYVKGVFAFITNVEIEYIKG
ncbi:hypothetical protein [uncultured Brachyspira sp.]|uniref:hypothetical protein n=1 Tax=uncultured Brachyspira sp. TaxID=221953 RepID=UPI002613C488|nr:hypothetical protein [uncultured Brachyspira sp.]